MAEEGASVVVCDLGGNVDGSGQDVSVAQQVVNDITQAGGKAVACTESVVSMEGGEKIIQTAIDNFGRLDIVVTCAGILRDRMVFNMTEQEWDDVIAVHLKGTFTVVKHACILFRQQRSGRVITFSSESRPRWQQRPGQLRCRQERHRRFHQSRRQGYGTLRRNRQLHRPPGHHTYDCRHTRLCR